MPPTATRIFFDLLHLFPIVCLTLMMGLVTGGAVAHLQGHTLQPDRLAQCFMLVGLMGPFIWCSLSITTGLAWAQSSDPRLGDQQRILWRALIVGSLGTFTLLFYLQIGRALGVGPATQKTLGNTAPSRRPLFLPLIRTLSRP